MTDGPVDAALARTLVRQQFPRWADLELRPVAVDGWDNRTFRLGSALSVRLPSGPGYDSQVRKELEWLPHIAPRVPLPVPEVVALGLPGAGYPFEWSVRRWIPGTPVRDVAELDRGRLAHDLAAFLLALRRVPTAGGPAPGEHSQHRGGPLLHWDDEVRSALVELGSSVDRDRARGLWEDALAAASTAPGRWLHGDVAPGNLLTEQGALSAVIDFGCATVGDPSCDLVLAWTSMTAPARAEFRRAMAVDDEEWARGIGWALWKALITVRDPDGGTVARTTLRELGVAA